jgi:hypothetical protein
MYYLPAGASDLVVALLEAVKCDPHSGAITNPWTSLPICIQACKALVRMCEQVRNGKTRPLTHHNHRTAAGINARAIL